MHIITLLECFIHNNGDGVFEICDFTHGNVCRMTEVQKKLNYVHSSFKNSFQAIYLYYYCPGGFFRCVFVSYLGENENEMRKEIEFDCGVSIKNQDRSNVKCLCGDFYI